mmetsp:Transcript_91712/g.159042  ORF Transcript_91712/g.159042 Transcript_91712/m.159042 type:complete len:304 (-) Transcript_91712:1327-2238(-)
MPAQHLQGIGGGDEDVAVLHHTGVGPRGLTHTGHLGPRALGVGHRHHVHVLGQGDGGAHDHRCQMGGPGVHLAHQFHEDHPQVYVLRGVLGGQQAQDIPLDGDGVDGGRHLGALRKADAAHVVHQHWGHVQGVEGLCGAQGHLEVRGRHLELQLVVHLGVRHSVAHIDLAGGRAEVPLQGGRGGAGDDPALEDGDRDREVGRGPGGPGGPPPFEGLGDGIAVLVSVVDSAEVHLASGLVLPQGHRPNGPQPILCALDGQAVGQLRDSVHGGVHRRKHSQALAKVSGVGVRLIPDLDDEALVHD